MIVQIAIKLVEGNDKGEAGSKVVVPYTDGTSIQIPVLNALVNLLPLVFDKAMSELAQCRQ